MTRANQNTKQITKAKRNAKGQYMPGASGNPLGYKRFSFTKRFLSSIKVSEVAAVAEALKAKAIKGDLKAIKLFLDYVILPPTQTIEQTTTTIDEKTNPEELRLEFNKIFNRN